MKFILVDFENVHESNYKELLSKDVRLEIFLGESQNKIPTDLVLGIQNAPGLGMLIQISGNGKNALDFHIAYELGRIFNEYKDAECVIVSKDTGYDPLIEKICKDFEKKCCRRVCSVAELLPAKKKAAETKTAEKKPVEKKPVEKKPAAAPKTAVAKPAKAEKVKAAEKNVTVIDLPRVLKWLKKNKENRPVDKESLVSTIHSWGKMNGFKKKAAEKIVKDLQSQKALDVLPDGKIKYLL